MKHPSTDIWLSGDLRNVLRGLAVSTTAMPVSEFRGGYLAALAAVGVALGIIDDDELRTGAAFLLPPGGRQ